MSLKLSNKTTMNFLFPLILISREMGKLLKNLLTYLLWRWRNQR